MLPCNEYKPKLQLEFRPTVCIDQINVLWKSIEQFPPYVI